MKKVLLASESDGFLERNTELLLQRGFQILTVTSGEAALNLHQENPLDLVIADYKLDDMLGYALCTQLNSDKHLRQIPTVSIARNASEDDDIATKCGDVTILLKPVDPKKLLEIITSAIELQVVRSKRVALNVHVVCKKPELDISCLSHNISNTGILIETDQLAIGTRIKCEFSLPDLGHVDVEGEVVRIATSPEGKQLCGVKFIQTPLSSVKTIISYVGSMAASAPDSIIPHYPSQHCMCA